MFAMKIPFEPMSLKRHRHRMTGRTYDPSKKDKDAFIQAVGALPEEKMSRPLRCQLFFYCKRPKNHYKTGKNSHILKDTAPIHNTNSKDLDNMVKFVLDAFNDKLYVDDCLVVEIHCRKLYSEEESGYIEVVFEELAS
jgi:Holliday junction resolvase RusA-like endonuclease